MYRNVAKKLIFIKKGNCYIKLNTCCVVLKALSLEDINAILYTKEFIGDRTCFRYNLKKWRAENIVTNLAQDLLRFRVFVVVCNK